MCSKAVSNENDAIIATIVKSIKKHKVISFQFVCTTNVFLCNIFEKNMHKSCICFLRFMHLIFKLR